MNITAGIYKGQKITAPDENITRPTLSKVRMSVFNTLQSMIDFENSSFLDMYAGSGIMGLEALSRGFSKIVSNKDILDNDSKLTRVYLATEEPPTIETDTWPGSYTWFIFTQYKQNFYVPRQSVSTYQSATNWSARRNYINASSELYNNTY